ncbi:alpha/beta hydrolase [Acinetobacter pittii]|uniref:alpha/beta fold hydrolase n=1 Tax=Acinetobacter pittii TaxID=48296 RepID=UPI001EFC8B51|nr:alpha/beta hydrolase [Acinetobacter pittii]MCG9494470.1 alpha/beta hydrolase [Acinetobacter pittii]
MIKEEISLVFIPGFMLDESLWDEVSKELINHQNRIKANLIHGNTIQEIAQNITKNAPEKFLLVGFSLGGYIARSLAEQFPDRVRGLVLIASSLRSDTEEEKKHKLTAIRLNSKETFRGLSSISIARALHPSNDNNKVLIKRIQEMGKNLGYEEFVKQSLLNRETYDTNKILCPTLIISGAQDQMRSIEEAEEMHRKIKNSTLKVIEETGHMIPLEQPKKLVTTILGWMNDEIKN